MSKKDESKIKFKNEMECEEAIVYFASIVDGLKRGSLLLQQGDERVELKPAGKLKVKVKAARKDDKESFSFELSWSAPRLEETIAVVAQPEENADSGSTVEAADG